MPTERSLTQLEAQQLAGEFRERFRNTEAFTAAWDALFSLRSAITPTLARRILSEELAKFQARIAGQQDATWQKPSGPPLPVVTYRCPGCHYALSSWDRKGHAETCPYEGLYELEVRARCWFERLHAERAARKAALLAETPMPAQEPTPNA